MLITSADLKTQTKSDLAQMAKRLGVSSSNALSKDQLVAAIVKLKKNSSKGKAAKKPTAGQVKKPASKNVTAPSKGTKKVATSASRIASRPAIKPALVAKKGAPKLKVDSLKKKSAAPSKPSLTAAKAAADSKTSVRGKESTAKVTSNKEAMGKGIAAKTVASKSQANKVINGRSAHSAKANGTSSMAKSQAKLTSAEKRTVAPRKPSKPAPPPTNPAVLQRIREIQGQRESTKDLSKELASLKKTEGVEEQPPKDRIVLLVRDAYWLQVSWDITRRAVERARAAMGEYWHHAQPILRLLRLDDSGTTSAAETIERDIVIHGGVRNWYIDLNGTPGRFRVMIGYLSGNRFHMLAKSNIVRTPTSGAGEGADDHWSDIARDAERIFALSGGYDSEQETTELQEVFEDRLKRSMGGPQLAQYGSGAETAFRGRSGFHFDMEVELYVYGSTVPDGFVTLNDEPVKLRSDGTFSLRLPFPDRRQVLPARACSRDGVQQRTIVVAVERNTKIMEPFSKEQDEQG